MTKSTPEEAIRRCCNRMGYDQDKEFPKKNRLKNVFSLCINKGLNVDDAVSKKYQDYEDLLDEIKCVQQEYAEYKRKNNCVDYDDLLVYLKAILEIDGVRERLSSRYRYIMVDEFQDTNGVQADIVRLLAQKHGNVMVVGDDAQSIYGFRGANHLNILEFPKKFGGCKVIKLQANYRSTQSILDVGNAVLTNMSHKFEKRLVSAMGNTGEKPTLRRFNDVYDEATWIAQKVLRLKEEGVEANEMAVLFRTAHVHAPPGGTRQTGHTVQALRWSGSFYEMAYVRDVVSYLRIVANPADELAWQRVLLLLPGIGVKTAERLLDLIVHYTSLSDIIDKVFALLLHRTETLGNLCGYKEASPSHQQRIHAGASAGICHGTLWPDHGGEVQEGSIQDKRAGYACPHGTEVRYAEGFYCRCCRGSRQGQQRWGC